MEEAGVSAVVMYSLFEEQIIHESLELDHYLAAVRSGSPRRSPIFPMPALSAYCRIDMWRIQRLKKAVNIPVIGSLNGVSKGGWTRYANLVHRCRSGHA